MAYAKIEIAPSILASNFARLGEDIRAVEQGGADVIHVDVMDGHFVPNISIGIPVVDSLHKATRLPLEVHLMIERPEEYIERFVQAGANRVLIHQEATVHLDRALTMIRELGAQAGAAIYPATAVATLTDVFEREPEWGLQFLFVLFRRELSAAFRTVISGGNKVGNTLSCCLLGELAHSGNLGIGRVEFTRAETLGHHVGQVVVDDVCLRKVNSIGRIRGGRYNQVHRRPRCDCAGPRRVKRCLGFFAST